MKRIFLRMFGVKDISYARERVEAAQRDHAQFVGECGYAEAMVLFYENKLRGVDPNVDWWYFADQRQKLQDMRDQLVEMQHKAEEAFAKANARMDELVRIEGGQA